MVRKNVPTLRPKPRMSFLKISKELSETPSQSRVYSSGKKQLTDVAGKSQKNYLLAKT